MMRLYTVQPGKQAAAPLVLHTDFGRNPSAGWKMSLAHGWDYELPRNRDQWLKACGETFNLVNRDKNTVICGIRRLPGAELVQLSPYYNVDGEQVYWENQGRPDDWPVVNIPIDEERDFFFAYRAEGARVTTTIILPDWARYLHRFTHKGIGCIQSEVNFYFGGSEPALQQIGLWKQRLTYLDWGTDGGLVRA